MKYPLLCLWSTSLVALLCAGAIQAEPFDRDFSAARDALDQTIDQHLQAHGLSVAPPIDDAGFIRRLMLDLWGRIPTPLETKTFVNDPNPRKRADWIERMLDSPEFALYWGDVLEQMIQGSGDREFARYLRFALARRHSWETIFRQIMLGPWDNAEILGSRRFLAQRIRSIDNLTADTTRAFFGVDITCAKCHDHPLVDDWTQDHYYGMAAFFHRTYEHGGKEKIIGEKSDGVLSFVTTKGQKRDAKLMFLTGQVILEPQSETKKSKEQDKDGKKNARRQNKRNQNEPYHPPVFSLREQLVKAALGDSRFFRRSLPNRVWAELMGRGLVHPVDQMHSANESAISGALEVLADDFARHGYALDRLVGLIVSSRAYQRSSESSAVSPPEVRIGAVAGLRPLSPRALALSIQVAAREHRLDQSDPSARAKEYERLENLAQSMVPWLDQPGDEYQASSTEALYLSNHASVQDFIRPNGKNLASRLLLARDDNELLDEVFFTVLSRKPDVDERQHLRGFLTGSNTDSKANPNTRAHRVTHLIWSLVTCAEFRFNH